MKLHPATLKSASARFRPMIEAGKTIQEIKDAIAADDKAFAAEAVEEIMADLFPDHTNKAESGKNPNPDNQDRDNLKGSENGKGDEGIDTGNTGKDNLPNKKTIGKTFIVTNSFRDISDFSKEHAIGSDVSHFNETRLKTLIDKGLIEQK